MDPKNIVGAGIYVYSLNDTFPVLYRFPNYDLRNLGVFTYQQYIQQNSKVPQGSLGIDFEVFEDETEFKLLVRDYIIPVKCILIEAVCFRSNKISESLSFK